MLSLTGPVSLASDAPADALRLLGVPLPDGLKLTGLLSADGALYLVDAGVVLVGIDSVNIDDTESGGERPAHSLLLGAGVHVVEHLTNLGALPSSGARFTAAPPAIEGFGTFPVRAFAEL